MTTNSHFTISIGETEIKPCPFCGSRPSILLASGEPHKVCCETPNCVMMEMIGAVSLERWNKRVGSDYLAVYDQFKASLQTEIELRMAAQGTLKTIVLGVDEILSYLCSVYGISRNDEILKRWEETKDSVLKSL